MLLLTPAQMALIEREAIEQGEVTGLALMERAGREVVDVLLAEWPALACGRRAATVLCGPGNNGGDGFVVARLLHGRGWWVEVVLLGDAGRLPPDARANHDRWRALGEVHKAEAATIEGAVSGVDLAVDALFGGGLARPIPALAQNALNAAARHEAKIVAVDGLSGLDLRSGRYRGDPSEPVPAADLTVTFQAPRTGHHLAWGPRCSGRLRVADIGLGRRVREAMAGGREARSPGHATCWLAMGEEETAEGDRVRPLDALAKRPGHKYDHGHALVLSGGPGRGGAARMAARGALRIGAGLVTLGCPPGALQENAARLDAVMTRAVKGPEGLGAMLADERLAAFALGPGLGGGEVTRALVGTALRARRATVLDADALTAFADDPGALFALLHERCVLTPHGGEFARLFPDIAERLAAPAEAGPVFSKVDATREAAARAGCVVLHKGPATVIADPSGRAAINSAAYERAAPWLATAGAGDVLTGFIAGLLARGLAPMEAAEAAAWLHVECALAFGPGLIAEDLPDRLPEVLRGLGL